MLIRWFSGIPVLCISSSVVTCGEEHENSGFWQLGMFQSERLGQLGKADVIGITWLLQCFRKRVRDMLWCWCEGQRSGSEDQVQCGTAQGMLQAFPHVLVQAGTTTENEALALAVFCTSTLCHPKCSVQPKHKAGRLSLPQITCSKSCLQDQSLKEQHVFFSSFFRASTDVTCH